MHAVYALNAIRYRLTEASATFSMVFNSTRPHTNSRQVQLFVKEPIAIDFGWLDMIFPSTWFAARVLKRPTELGGET